MSGRTPSRPQKPAIEWLPLWQMNTAQPALHPATPPRPRRERLERSTSQTHWQGPPYASAPYPTSTVQYSPHTPTGRRASHHALIPYTPGHSSDPYRAAHKHNRTPSNSPRKASVTSHRPAPVLYAEAPSVLPRASLSGLRLQIPLPHDLDPVCYIPITVAGTPGLRIVRCVYITKEMPNQAILHYVDDATRCIDDLVRIHEQRLIVHRAYFANQRGAETAVATKPPVEKGLTIAHLLTLMIRKQYDGWMKTVGKMTSAAKVEDVVGRCEGALAGVEVEYGDLYVVAIRRSTGRDGRVRWFPQIEVRFGQ